MIRRAEWLVIPDFEGHEVNARGEVRHRDKKAVLKSSTNQTGVRYVNIRNTKTMQYETCALSRLVAAAFCEGRSPKTDTVLHLDGDLNNMEASNLKWTTRTDAITYHKEINDPRFMEKRRIQEGSGRIFKSVHDAARFTGCPPSAIDYAVRYNDNLADDVHANFVNRIWPGGYVFKSA